MNWVDWTLKCDVYVSSMSFINKNYEVWSINWEYWTLKREVSVFLKPESVNKKLEVWNRNYELWSTSFELHIWSRIFLRKFSDESLPPYIGANLKISFHFYRPKRLLLVLKETGSFVHQTHVFQMNEKKIRFNAKYEFAPTCIRDLFNTKLAKPPFMGYS